jgi:hypothetical protein
VERSHSKSFPKRVVLHQGQLDVPSVEDYILFGQNVFGEYACDLFIGEDSLLRVDLINRPHHLQEEWL